MSKIKMEAHDEALSAHAPAEEALREALIKKFSEKSAAQVTMADIHELVSQGLCLMESPSVKQDESILYRAAKGNRAFRFFCTSLSSKGGWGNASREQLLANYMGHSKKTPRELLVASLRAGVLRDCVFPPVVIWELSKVKGL